MRTQEKQCTKLGSYCCDSSQDSESELPEIDEFEESDETVEGDSNGWRR